MPVKTESAPKGDCYYDPNLRKRKRGRGRKRGARPDFFKDLLSIEDKEIVQEISGHEIDEDQLLASICRDSFYEFVKEFWGEISNEIPVWNWHIKYICDVLQKAIEKVHARLPHDGDIIINIPPGTTKSTVCSVMLEAWAWTKMPDAAFCCISHTHALAIRLASLSRDVVQSEKYKRLFPGIRLREDQNTKGFYKNSQKGYRFSASSLSSVIGVHFHAFIIDDPIDPQSALSETEMLAINRWISEGVETRKINKEVTVSILVMQRLHEDDPTADKKKRDKNVRHYVLPADITDSEVAKLVSPPNLKEFYIDNLLDPVRLSLNALEQYRAKGNYFFSGQFDQDPSPAGGGMFHINAIKMREVPAADWKKLIRFWDKAASQGGGAYSVGVLMGRDSFDGYWILDVQRGQWDSYQREQRILDTARADGVRVMVGIEQEGGSGGKESAERTARALAGYVCRIVLPTGDKVVRADPFSSMVNSGNVYMKIAPWNRAYLDEMKHFPLSRYKDQIDACLTKGTMVQTSNGLKPIESILAGEFVLTRQGFKKVLWSGQSGCVDRITTVRFQNGISISGTPEHLVWTQERGFIRLDAVEQTDSILFLGGFSCGIQKSYSLKASNSQEKGTTIGAGEARTLCTEPYGDQSMEKSLLNTISITRMKTRSTTKYPIWNVSPRKNIGRNIEKINEHLSNCSILKELDILQRSGINRRKAESGIGSTVEMLSKKGLQGFLFAINARNSINQKVLGFRENIDSAHPFAEIDFERQADLEKNPKNALCAIRSIWECPEPKPVLGFVGPLGGAGIPVYDLHVEEAHEFFANGILVHNSAGAFTLHIRPVFTAGALGGVNGMPTKPNYVPTPSAVLVPNGYDRGSRTGITEIRDGQLIPN